MSPNESLKFFEAQLERSKQGFGVARISRNLQLAALNGRQMFKAYLMCGLINWRMGESPVNFFKTGVEFLVESSDLLASWQPSFVPAENLPVARGALLASLLDMKFVVPETHENLAAQDQLDYALLNSATHAAQLVINKLKSGKRTELAAEAYETYFAILASVSNIGALDVLVGRAEALYLQRARDGFFSGGEQTEGGGPDNGLVVDYRLAVALKRAGYTGKSIHAWRW